MPPPQISLPNQHREAKEADAVGDQPKKEPPTKPKQADPKAKPSGEGWFGGIFNKLTLKPKNQMKLPDDKNPTILWDSEKKRWVNTDEDAGDGASDFKPPPKMSEMAPKPSPAFPAPKIPTPEQPLENGNVPKAGQPNMFKLQRNRNLKKSYIDVFNPNAKAGSAALAPPAPVGVAPGAQPMNFFVPQPVHDPNAPMDFLTPAPPMTFEDSQVAQ